LIKFDFDWKLSDLEKVPKLNYNVFSCFSSGGGSSMGYKLNGFNLVGCLEIDEKIIEIYKHNLKPKIFYNESIVDFAKREKFEDALYNLDILDGSPPCSSFSTAGNREKDWGKKKVFAEGQKEQVLDTLFFDFIKLAGKLKPKVVVAENVKGIIMGKAKNYYLKIIKEFKNIGYDVQVFLLNASTMGVPQRRERVFFIANRVGKKIKLNFNEKELALNNVLKNLDKNGSADFTKSINYKYWLKCSDGESFSKYHEKGSLFNSIKLNRNKSSSTLTTCNLQYHWLEPRTLSFEERRVISTFPKDYNFFNNNNFLTGMCVPPFMMQRISWEIKQQLLD
jgi:DNA (cytosine-5)-methyltransferase 1